MMQEQVFAIIREVFARPDLELSETTTAADVEGWDSFNHMNLIMRIEEEYDITFETEEIGRMGNVGELVATVTAKAN